MEKKVINKPQISRLIGGGYIILTIFITILFIGIAFGTDIRFQPINIRILFFGIMIFALFLMSFTTFSLYRTKYVIQDGILHSWSPFTIINLRISDIKKIERTMIPIHVRVGASLYSGTFYILGLGWARAIITNLNDGVLITTKDKKYYLITPSNPDKFIKLLKRS
jgi:hypothetical protein